MNKQQLSDQYAIPGILAFDENEHGLVRAVITSDSCTAELYLQGAHLAQWQPAGDKPVLFLSHRSVFQPGKSIRGGVPVIFPWFGARSATPYSLRTDGPSHGFARTSIWQFVSATIDGADLVLVLTLGPSDATRALGCDHFLVTYALMLGKELSLRLTVENNGETPMQFEEALHTYLTVGDAQKISISGLADCEYLDKTDGFKRKQQAESKLVLTGETDRPYLNTGAQVDLDDPTFKRRISVEKQGSKTTVVWNPWSELTAKLADMDPDGWLGMTCIETANAADNAVTLAPGGQHTMDARIEVKQLDS